MAAAFNHSCSPNAVVSFKQQEISIRYASKQPCVIGEEFTISYIDTAMPWAMRQEALLSGYGFTCKCARCLTEAGHFPYVLKCCRLSCPGTVTTGHCTRCSSTACMEGAVQDVFSSYTEFKTLKKNIDSYTLAPHLAIEQLTLLYHRLSPILHGTDYIFLTITNALASLLLEQGCHKEALPYYKLLLCGYPSLYPTTTPSLGLTLTTYGLALVEYHLQQYQEAIPHFQNVHSQLSILYGTDNLLSHDILQWEHEAVIGSERRLKIKD